MPLMPLVMLHIQIYSFSGNCTVPVEKCGANCFLSEEYLRRDLFSHRMCKIHWKALEGINLNHIFSNSADFENVHLWSYLLYFGYVGIAQTEKM